MKNLAVAVRIILIMAIIASVLAPMILVKVAQAGWHNCRPAWGGQKCDDDTGHTWIRCNRGWTANP